MDRRRGRRTEIVRCGNMEILVATATTKGLDFASILEYGRKNGSPALRKMTFQEREEC